jgi:hypothetical protein
MLDLGGCSVLEFALIYGLGRFEAIGDAFEEVDTAVNPFSVGFVIMRDPVIRMGGVPGTTPYGSG